MLLEKPTNLVKDGDRIGDRECLKGQSQRAIEALAVILGPPHVCSSYMTLSHRPVYRHSSYTQRESEAHSGYLGETLSKTKRCRNGRLWSSFTNRNQRERVNKLLTKITQLVNKHQGGDLNSDRSDITIHVPAPHCQSLGSWKDPVPGSASKMET